MPKRSTPRRTESGARAAFMGAAEHLWDAFNAWYEAHREATFDETRWSRSWGDYGRS